MILCPLFAHPIPHRVRPYIQRDAQIAVIPSDFLQPGRAGEAGDLRKIVETILTDSELRGLWEREVAQMRDRINGTRKQFVQRMKQLAPTHDFSFIETQRGMFSFSGLSAEQVGRLRNEYSIYIVGSGRINVAGITPQNLEPLCNAIAAVL